MSTPSRFARALPAVPNLEQQKKLARDLLEAVRAHDAEALARVRAHHPRFAANQTGEPDPAALSLHDAQLVLAREYGFPSWPKLKAHIEAVVASRWTYPLERNLAYYDDRAHGLLTVLADGAPSTLEQVRGWHPEYAGAPDETIREAAAAGTFTLDDARLVYAREHGFATWDRLAAHLRRLQAGKVAEPFVDLLEAGKNADWKKVTAILQSRPELVRARGTNGNSLLSLASGMLPCPGQPMTGAVSALLGRDRLGPVRFLLAAGANPNQQNDRGWTPLHDAGYRNDAEMAALLLEAGARPDLEAHGAGGTPLAVALFWGNREAAETLAEPGVFPRNLRVAAGLGRPELIAECFGDEGRLSAAARANRGFYRPHSGFPTWRPSDDPVEVLDEALVWAAKSGRTEAMALLLDSGARVHAAPYRGTPLLWAAAIGRVGAAAWLLDHGAEVNQRATFGGPAHGEGVTALHLAAQNGDVPMIELLLARGADRTIEDLLYHSTPAAWAEHHGFDIPVLRAGRP
jgi:ankyrin repeat protein